MPQYRPHPATTCLRRSYWKPWSTMMLLKFETARLIVKTNCLARSTRSYVEAPISERLMHWENVPASNSSDKSRTMAIPLPSLTFRFLFAYHDRGFPGPTVGHHEFTRRTKQRGWTVVSEAVGSSESCAYALLRLPGNAATLALLPPESFAGGKEDSLPGRCESDQSTPNCAFC